MFVHRPKTKAIFIKISTASASMLYFYCLDSLTGYKLIVSVPTRVDGQLLFICSDIFSVSVFRIDLVLNFSSDYPAPSTSQCDLF